MINGATPAALDFNGVGNGIRRRPKQESGAGATTDIHHFKKLTTQSQRAALQGTGVTVVNAARQAGFATKLSPAVRVYEAPEPPGYSMPRADM